jgi:uncharacterized repeat protein (TIGR01451 family)
MRKEVFFVLFLILIPVAMGEILLDGEVDDMETFKAGEHYFYVEYVESTISLVFKIDDMGGIMELGECEIKENIKYCFEDVNYPKIGVKIESLEPDISVERSFSTTTPYLNEQITVTVTLKNSGDRGATNVKYADPYPAGLRVYADKNTRVWEGKLNIGEEETFKYPIKAEDIVSYDSIATLTYTFEGEKKTKKSSKVTIEVQKPFSISHDISTEAADKNEVVDYNLTINNEHDSDRLEIKKLEILIPSQAELVKTSSNLGKQDEKLVFDGAIEKKESQKFTVRLKSPRVGKFKIRTLATLEISGMVFEEELEKQFNVGLSYILPILNVTDSVKSNSPYSVYIAVKNYGGDEIENVNIKAESELFENIEKKRTIAAGTAYEVFKKTLTAPYLEEDKKYNIKISGSYTSSSGKVYTFEKSAQLEIKGVPKIINIIKEFNKEEFYPGDEIKVIVKIKNLKNTVIEQIDVSDIFPREIRSSLIGDVTGELDKLEPNEEKKVYSYSLVVPEDYKEGEIEFKTNINAKVDGELIILKRVDNVKILGGEKSEVTGEEVITEEEIDEDINRTEGVAEGEEDVKENFFKKIINWIKNLFKKKD